jgi:quercetin dioxygenase-like cupin family protein
MVGGSAVPKELQGGRIMLTIRNPNVALKQLPMPEPLAEPGEVVDLRPLEAAFDTHQNILLVKTTNVTIFQQFIPAGGSLPTHEAQGEIILHCITGRATLTVLGESHELATGQLLYLRLNEPFSIKGIEHSALLVTIIAAKRGSNVKLIGE